MEASPSTQPVTHAAECTMPQSIQSQLQSQQSQLSALNERPDSKTTSESTQLSSSRINSIAFNASQQEHGIAFKLHSLETPHRKFYTHISAVPDELVIQIFAWLNPRYVFKYRQLTRRFDTLLSSKYFAIQSLRRAIGPPETPMKEDEDFTTCCTDTERAFICAPPNYQSILLEKYWSSRDSIIWMLKKVPFPSIVCSLKDLDFLHLTGMTHLFPYDIGKMTKLRSIYLDKCIIDRGFPAEMRFLTDLRYLEITNCKYEGLFPEVLFSLIGVQRLNFENISLYGPLSASVGSLTNLRLLILRGTSLSGSIPSEIGTLVNLRNLCLEKSQFSGTIPSSIGMLTLLHTLILKSNKLEGNVPRELLNLTLLHTCDLRFNEGLSCDFEFPLLRLGNDKDVDKSDDESDGDDELSDGFGN